MLKIYRCLIRSKLDYGIPAYSSTRKTVLTYLDTIHHQGLRISSGAFRTSPVQSLYVLCNESSLEYRRKRLSLDYYFRIKSQPHNPLHDSITSPQNDMLFSARSSFLPTFGIRMKTLLEELHVPNYNTFKMPDPLPPWIEAPNFILNCFRDFKKAEFSSIVLSKRFFEHREIYKDFNPVYTDGSKHDDHVGSAAICNEYSFTEKLDSSCSIFTAECHAILLALDFISRLPPSKLIIYTDSQSFTTAFSQNNKHPLVALIFNNTLDVSKSGHILFFCWVPAHTGILGNEKADMAAKSTMNLNKVKVILPDIKSCYNKSLNNAWQNFWDLQTENKYHEFQPKINIHKTFYHNRKSQTILNRLLLGHTRYTHAYLLLSEPHPFCPVCHKRITVKHILTECLRFIYVRKQLFGNKYPELKILIGDNIHPNFFRYIKAINLFNKI